MQKSFQTIDDFSAEAGKLRQEFETRFRDPKQISGERFIWDYWHLPRQYTQLRTPAQNFFSKPVYERFHQNLVWWGRRNLGCHDITPTWLSCYVDGCEQRLHGDLPHGPWAFVFSLTPWQGRKFSGGETLLLREKMLDYWPNLDRFSGLEEEQIFERIAPKFNRLVVFDPRIPHGVEQVKGVQDICEARLVLHGWFVNPRPFIEGPLPRAALGQAISLWTKALGNFFSDAGEIRGLLSIALRVAPGGTVSGVKVLSNNLKSASHRPQDATRLVQFLGHEIRRVKFPRAKAPSQITVPFMFTGAAE